LNRRILSLNTGNLSHRTVINTIVRSFAFLRFWRRLKMSGLTYLLIPIGIVDLVVSYT